MPDTEHDGENALSLPASAAERHLAPAAEVVAAAILQRLGERGAPLLVALDGGSGAGKSVLAGLVARAIRATGAVVVPSDDFCDVETPESEWAACSPAERAARIIDWQRLRRDALDPLLAGRPASYDTYDYPLRYAAGRVVTHRVTLASAPVILLDGISSARPELADLLGLTVLVDAPPATRRARHDAREPDDQADWHRLWDPAEAHYLRLVRPPSAFDLIVRSE